MAPPAQKRFTKTYGPMADAISRLDIGQSDRELVAAAITEALRRDQRSHKDFIPATFRLIASDPLVLCAGYDDTPCPDKREIRIAMHNGRDEDGNLLPSEAWRSRKPTGIRCVSCGARQFIPGYPKGES